MNRRTVGALLCSLLGVAIPVVFMLLRYGLNDRVSATTITSTQLLELLGGMAIAVLGGLCSALLLRSSAPTLGQVIREALHESAKEERRRHTVGFRSDGEGERRASV